MHFDLRKFAFGTWMLFSASTGLAQNRAVTVQVDVNASRKPINPLIYGVAHASTAALPAEPIFIGFAPST